MMSRADVPFFVSKLMGGRPTRWAPQDLACGDYDGRGQTLEVFLADARDQLALLGAIDEAKWAELEAAAGGPIVYLFHTTKESHARYADFLREFDEGLPVDAKPAAAPRPLFRYVDRAEGRATPHRQLLQGAA
jgi:hypothetical protein